MRCKALFLSAALVCLTALLSAWAYTASDTVTINGTLNGVSLPTGKITASGGHPQAYYASCRNDPLFSSGTIRWTTDPAMWLFAASTTAGAVLLSGETVNLTSTEQLLQFRAVITGITPVTLTCQYWSQQ